MILPDAINKRFYKALAKKWAEYGRGFNKFLCGETGYTSGYISQVLNGNQTASQEAQIKISDACGLDYKSFLEDSNEQADTPADAPPLKIIPGGKIIEFQSETEKKHFDVIRNGFKDKETALMFNSYLARLETINPRKYEAILADIKGDVKEYDEQQEAAENKALGGAQKNENDKAG
jgi:transcriptional regulator with XRE-family HTH domain